MASRSYYHPIAARHIMIWIFAYGSLIWRPGFSHEQRLLATVTGYERRFCQASHDHRGTAENPGRVVTMVNEPDSHCEGLAYQLDTREQDAILRSLDEREQDGYERTWLDACLADGQQIRVLTWIAGPDNPSWRGGESMNVVASLIANRRGPSGSNQEYLFQLDNALRHQAIQDEYVAHLAQLVRSHVP